METRKTRGSGDGPKEKTVAATLILIGCCAAVAIFGIFIGAIVIYGGIHD